MSEKHPSRLGQSSVLSHSEEGLHFSDACSKEKPQNFRTTVTFVAAVVVTSGTDCVAEVVEELVYSLASVVELFSAAGDEVAPVVLSTGEAQVTLA